MNKYKVFKLIMIVFLFMLFLLQTLTIIKEPDKLSSNVWIFSYIWTVTCCMAGSFFAGMGWELEDTLDELKDVK